MMKEDEQKTGETTMKADWRKRAKWKWKKEEDSKNTAQNLEMIERSLFNLWPMVVGDKDS